MKNTLIPFLLIFSAHATTLKEVISYSLKNAPQFQEQTLSSQAQVESLKKIFSIYDTQLSLSTIYNQGTNSSNYQDETTNSSEISFSKNIGLGVNIEATTGLNSRKSSSANTYQTSVKLGADIDLLKNLLGKIDRNSILIQNQDRKLLENALSQTRESLLFGIIDAYLNVARLERLLKENRELNKNIQVLVKATKRKKTIGAADSRNVLQMDAKLINSRMTIMELERMLQNSYDQLETITGGGKFKELSWPKIPNTKPTRAFSLQLEALSLEQEKLQLQYSSAKWNRLPDLKLSLSYQYGDLDQQGYSYDVQQNGKGVGIFLSFPLGNSSAQADYKSGQLSLLAKKLTYQRESQEFKQDLAQYERSIKNYNKQIELAATVISLQKKRYSQEVRAYTQGRSGINDINTAQNDLINAQITHIEKHSSFHQYTYGKKYLQGSLESLFLK